MTSKGTLVAAAVAGLFASAPPMAARAADGDKVKCHGVNACKGKGGCKAAANECKGHNGCKGKGWVELTEQDCKAKKGTIMKGEAK